MLQQTGFQSSRLCPGPPSTSCSSQLAQLLAPFSAAQQTAQQRQNGAVRRSSATHAVYAAATADAPVKRAEKIPPLPFVKVAGQEEMKLALLLNVVDPGIGGVLIMGDRGTGKSIAVRYKLQQSFKDSLHKQHGVNRATQALQLLH